MTFIICSRKKSMSRMSISVCERCARKKHCPDYAAFIQPPLFKEFKKNLLTGRKRQSVKKGIKTSAGQSKEEQLNLDFL